MGLRQINIIIIKIINYEGENKMSNVCEEKMEFKLIEEQPTLMEIYKELNRLKLENKLLKADKLELQKEVIQLRNDKNELHNKSNENSKETTNNNNEGGWTEEEFDIVVKGYAMVENNKKFV
jgi:hypothetical protein